MLSGATNKTDGMLSHTDENDVIYMAKARGRPRAGLWQLVDGVRLFVCMMKPPD